MAKCEVATVRVEFNGAEIAKLEIPAYTQHPAIVHARIAELVAEYERLSETAGEPSSLADFGLWILKAASNDPREV